MHPAAQVPGLFRSIFFSILRVGSLHVDVELVNVTGGSHDCRKQASPIKGIYSLVMDLVRTQGLREAFQTFRFYINQAMTQTIHVGYEIEGDRDSQGKSRNKNLPT